MPGGQPTKYKPEYCELIVELFKTGESAAGFSAEVNISRETFHKWVNLHDEFKKAYNIAQMHAQRYYEKIGRASLAGIVPPSLKKQGSKRISENMAKFFLATRFHKDWGDKSKLDINHTQEEPISITIKRPDGK